MDELIETPRVRDAVELEPSPALSTLYKAFDRSEMAVWRVRVNASLPIHP